VAITSQTETLAVRPTTLGTKTSRSFKLLSVIVLKDNMEWRLHTLIMLLVDTEARIEEVLSARMPNVDLDNLLLRCERKETKNGWFRLCLKKPIMDRLTGHLAFLPKKSL
jgi:integrase